MNGSGDLAHAREGGCSLPDSILGVLERRCRVKGGIETVEKKGIEDLKDDIHDCNLLPKGRTLLLGLIGPMSGDQMQL